MSRALIYGGLLAGAGLVQTAWLARIEISGAILDPLLPIAVAVGILRGATSGAVVGLAGGLLQDLLSGGPLGVNGLTKLVVGFASGLFERSIYIENPLLPAVATFAGTLLSEILLVVVGQVTGLGRETAGALPRALMQAVLNSLAAPFLFRGVRRIEVRLERSR
ncbi:MAG TPA: rod shape-determining protein MreD [bacterium]|nr:rod shape-determining protein MreD [bacterium]